MMSDETPLTQPCKGLVGAAILPLSEGKNDPDFMLMEIHQVSFCLARKRAVLCGQVLDSMGPHVPWSTICHLRGTMPHIIQQFASICASEKNNQGQNHQQKFTQLHQHETSVKKFENDLSFIWPQNDEDIFHAPCVADQNKAHFLLFSAVVPIVCQLTILVEKQVTKFTFDFVH